MTEELRRDQNQWEKKDYHMNEMIEKWWEQMIENEEERNKFKNRMDTLEAEKKLDVMSQIAAGIHTFYIARKSFDLHRSKTTDEHINRIARAVGQVEMAKSEAESAQGEEVKLESLSNEWNQRKEEMEKTRKELTMLQQKRIDKGLFGIV